MFMQIFLTKRSVEAGDSEISWIPEKQCAAEEKNSCGADDVFCSGGCAVQLHRKDGFDGFSVKNICHAFREFFQRHERIVKEVEGDEFHPHHGNQMIVCRGFCRWTGNQLPAYRQRKFGESFFQCTAGSIGAE